MKRASGLLDAEPISEIAIVDTFTKLIFGEEFYSDRELLFIRTLRLVDDNVSLDDHCEMGVYLRALGVREMIQLVARVRTNCGDEIPPMIFDDAMRPLGQAPLHKPL